MPEIKAKLHVNCTAKIKSGYNRSGLRQLLLKGHGKDMCYMLREHLRHICKYSDKQKNCQLRPIRYSQSIRNLFRVGVGLVLFSFIEKPFFQFLLGCVLNQLYRFNFGDTNCFKFETCHTWNSDHDTGLLFGIKSSGSFIFL